MIKTALAKPYNEGDLILRIPENTGIKAGMKMRFICKKTKLMDVFTVKALGSIELKKPLSRDYPAGSKIEQVRTTDDNTTEAKPGSVLRAGDGGRKHDDGKVMAEIQDQIMNLMQRA